ncbi:MAG: ATP-binding cassette domain-containing protein [Alphaproteobacteria bacterium]|nr:ATP-binding cassette domain-containing protein [Alphaproteobacteria bacterium]
MLRISDLTYRIEGRLLLEQASATIPTGHKVGLVGRNGSGKSTLFRLITGEVEGEGGEISFPRTWRVGGVAQEAPGSDTSLIDTVLEADIERTRLMKESETAQDPHRIAEIATRLADIGAHSAPARAAEILSGLGFDHEAQQRPCSEFSGGWRMRVALAAVLFSDPDLLLLDEPTNYLDLEGALWLESYLKRFQRTLILISHDRDLLNTAVDSILHLENKTLSFYTGNYDTFERTRAEKIALREALRTKQEAQRKHMQAFVDRFRYKESKARQAQSRLKAIAKLQPIAALVEERVTPFRLGEPDELSPPLIALDGVSTGYEGRVVLSNISLRIDPDDRIALLGANGNGKSTFAKLISDRLEPMSGTITKARRMRTGYFAQHQLDEMSPELTPVQQLALYLPKANERELRTRLGAAGFPEEKVATQIGNLSGGERARLLIMFAALDSPHLLILDEPTNHLDIDSREALVHALNDYEGAVILISHDPHLIETCADRLWLVARGRVTPYDGDLDDYRRLLLSERKNQGGGGRQKSASGSRAGARRSSAERRSQLAPLKRQVDQAEKKLEILNDELSKVEAALNTPNIYEKEPYRVVSLTRERADLMRRVEAAEAEWLRAAEAHEQAAAETATIDDN